MLKVKPVNCDLGGGGPLDGETLVLPGWVLEITSPYAGALGMKHVYVCTLRSNVNKAMETMDRLTFLYEGIR